MGSEPGAQGPSLFSFRSFLAAVGRTFVAVAGLSPAAAVFLSGRPSQAEEDFGRDIRPLLKARCFGCHGSRPQKGKLNLERYLELSEVVADLKTWQTVAEKVSDGSMPPRGKPPLDDPERARIAHFYEALVRQAEGGVGGRPGRTYVVRSPTGWHVAASPWRYGAGAFRSTFSRGRRNMHSRVPQLAK